MDFEPYLSRTNEIAGKRTKEEEKYDKEVMRWLRKGKNIQKAIKKANQNYPKEALAVSAENIDDVAAHYDYLLQHEAIFRKISH